MKIQEHEGTTQTNQAKKQEIRAALEASQKAFHQLLDSLSEADWNRKYAECPWTVGELMTHVTASYEIIPRELAAARKGKNFLKLPPYIFNPIRIVSARLMNRTLSRRTIGAKFDTALDTILAALDTVREDEWEKGGYFYDEGYWTVEYIFRQQPKHLEEHAEEIRKILGR